MPTFDGKVIAASIQFQMERRRALVQAYARVRDGAIKAHESVLSAFPRPTSWDAVINRGRQTTDIHEFARELDAALRNEINALDRDTALIDRQSLNKR